MIIQIGFNCSTKDAAILRRALANVQRKALTEMEVLGGDLPKRLSLKYVEKLRTDISNQTYSGLYPAYNPRYADWKQKVGASLKFWELYGDLYYALQTYEEDKGWFAGIPEGVYDSGGKSWFGEGNLGEPKPIAMYGWMMEWGFRAGRLGAGNHPARPLFQPALSSFAVDKAQTMGVESLFMIGDRWK